MPLRCFILTWYLCFLPPFPPSAQLHPPWWEPGLNPQHPLSQLDQGIGQKNLWLQWIHLDRAVWCNSGETFLHLQTTDKSVTCSQCSCSAISFLFQERKWLWTDGSKFVFSRWDRNQPDNYRDKEHCTHINHKGTNIISKLPNGVFNWEETWIKTVFMFFLIFKCTLISSTSH